MNSVIHYHARWKLFRKRGQKFVSYLNSTVQNVSEGEELYKKLKLRFLNASFNFWKWNTNSLELQNHNDKMEKSVSPSSEIKNNDKIKVLGIVWDTIIWFILSKI